MNNANVKNWRVKAKNEHVKRTALNLPPNYTQLVQFNSDGVSVPINENTARQSVATGAYTFYESPDNVHLKEVAANKDEDSDKSPQSSEETQTQSSPLGKIKQK